MISKGLDRYNRRRPENAPLVTMNDLAAIIAKKTGKEATQSSIISVRQMFRRLEEGEQKSISLEVLKALKDFFEIDYNTLLGYMDE